MASLGELLGEYLFGMPQDAEVVEGTRGNVLPGAKYRLPDGTERWGVAAPQGLADALLGLGAAGGRVQDPNAPQGYVSQETLRRGGEGLAGSATLGSFATRAPAGALRTGAARRPTIADMAKAEMARQERDELDHRLMNAREVRRPTIEELANAETEAQRQALIRYLEGGM